MLSQKKRLRREMPARLMVPYHNTDKLGTAPLNTLQQQQPEINQRAHECH